MIHRTFRVGLAQGLEVYTASKMADMSERYPCCLRMNYEGTDVNVGSLLNIVAMGIIPGSEIVISADGEQEIEAVNAYYALLS